MGYKRKANRKKDSNQHGMIQQLEALGMQVYDASWIGHGVPDLIVFWRDLTLLVEVKRPGHETELTEAEGGFMQQYWKGGCIVASDYTHVLNWFEEQTL